MTDPNLELAQRILRDPQMKVTTVKEVGVLAEAFLDLAAEHERLIGFGQALTAGGADWMGRATRAEAKLDAVRKLHVREVDEVVGDYCYHCGAIWPCVTIKAVGDE